MILISEDEFMEFLKSMVEDLNGVLFKNIYDKLQLCPEKRKSLNPAFPYPNKLRIGIVDKFLLVEYCGPEDMSDDKIQTEGTYKPNIDIYDFLSIDINHISMNKLPANCPIENMAFFLGESIGYLCDYFYDITQMPSELIMLNGVLDISQIEKPQYISNTTFFWTDISGRLKIRHIDFLEIFPILDEGVAYHDINSLRYFSEFIWNYDVPDYEITLHKSLNEFIELINYDDTTETQITAYIQENPELLQYAFGLNKLNPQVTLEWQYETDRNNLRPDFMPQKMDGYCDIFEFKLPRLKSKSIVGNALHKQPSHEIDSAIAQLNDYAEWCSQKINTDWLEKIYGIKLLHPVKYLIMGHSDDFTPEERRKLRENRNVAIYTYDEFIELTRFQIYRFR